MGKTSWFAALLFVVFMFGSKQSTAQLQQADPQLPAPPFPTSRPAPEDTDRAHIEAEMAKKANLQRQEQIRNDTDQLLKLATELKAYVDKSNENLLSLDVIHKAEEIEKLARSVKEKMRTSY